MNSKCSRGLVLERGNNSNVEKAVRRGRTGTGTVGRSVTVRATPPFLHLITAKWKGQRMCLGNTAVKEYGVKDMVHAICSHMV